MFKTTAIVCVALIAVCVSAVVTDALPILQSAHAQNQNNRGTVLTCTTTKRGGKIPYALPQAVSTETFKVRNTGQGLQLERGNRRPEFLDRGRGNGNGRIGAPGQQISLTVRQDGLAEWNSRVGGRSQRNNRFEFGEARRIVFDEQTGDVVSYETEELVPIPLVISEYTECR